MKNCGCLAVYLHPLYSTSPTPLPIDLGDFRGPRPCVAEEWTLELPFRFLPFPRRGRCPKAVQGRADGPAGMSDDDSPGSVSSIPLPPRAPRAPFPLGECCRLP